MIRKPVCALFVMSLTAGLVRADVFDGALTKVDGNKVTFQKFGKEGDAVTLPMAKDAKILMLKWQVFAGGLGLFQPREETEPVEGGLKNEVFKKIPENGPLARFTTSKDNKTITQITVVGFQYAPLPKEIVGAWKEAGARVGIMGNGGGYGGGSFIPDAIQDVNWLPAFRFHSTWKEGLLAKLPAPAVPFGLSISNANLTNAGMKELAGLKQLQMLDLSGSFVPGTGLKELAALTNLQSLRVSAGPRLKEVASIKTLQALFVIGGVTDEGVKDLAGLKNLQMLSLRSSAVTDAGLKELAGLTNLYWLDLWNTKVSDAGLKHLASLKSLQYLDLSMTKVTDAGLKELAALKGLRLLFLGFPGFDTEVTAEGLKELQKALPDCKIRSAP